MERPPYFGADFSSLAEKPQSSPEIQEDDDDDDENEKEPHADKAEKTTSSKEMTGDEEQVAASKIGKGRLEAVRPEVETAPEGSVAEQEAVLAVAFLESFVEEVENGRVVEAALAESEAEIREVLGADMVEAEPDEPEVADPAVPQASAKPPVPPSRQTPPPPAGPGGPGRPPVGPPLGPGSPLFGPAGPGGPRRAGGNIIPPTPNIAANQAPSTIQERRPAGHYLLVGGIVGYLIGRRRGRIKTEKKLLPIQHKLEKEVTDLQQKIAFREARIRSLAHEQLTQKPELQQQIIERLEQRREGKPAGPERRAPDYVRPEKFGKFALFGERPAAKTPERPKSVELMTIPELLAIAERIKLEQASVKVLFETNRLNDEGLRRVIRAYLRGERYDWVIRDNLKTPEKFASPEQLQTNQAVSAQAGGPTQRPSWWTGQIAKPTVPSPTLPALAPRQDPYNQPATNKPKPTGLIAVVVIVAVALLIFVLTR